MHRIQPVVLALVITLLAACSESSKVTVHQPGVYKGAVDPLLSANSEERANSLRARFELGQLDR